MYKHEQIENEGSDADNAYQAFKEKFNECIAARLEYAESHIDAGSSYAHMPSESGVNAKDVNNWSKDYRYPNKYQLTENDLCEIISNGDFEMVAGHIFTPSYGENKYCIDSYAVNEIEEQLDHTSFELSEITFDDYMIRYAGDRSEYCVKKINKTWYAYATSDAVWYAIHTRQ